MSKTKTFRIYDANHEEYLFKGKSFKSIKDAEDELKTFFQLTKNVKDYVKIEDMMKKEVGIQFHMNDGSIVTNLDDAAEAENSFK